MRVRDFSTILRICANGRPIQGRIGHTNGPVGEPELEMGNCSRGGRPVVAQIDGIAGSATCRVLKARDVPRAQGAGQAFAGEPYLGGGIANPLAFAGHHRVDRGADAGCWLVQLRSGRGAFLRLL
jgi:hypothetical protein